MKKISLLLSLIFIFQLSSTNAQWILQNSNTTGNLYDIRFVDRYTGWAIGDGGAIIKTTNSGSNWVQVPNPTPGKPLSAIQIVNDSVIYYVGWFETIIKSTNGGNSWIELSNWPWGTGSNYEWLHFINENTGWIAGSGQKVVLTTDGGSSFHEIPVFVGVINKIYFRNPNEGVLAGGGLQFKKSNDGGYNWFDVNLSQGSFLPYIDDFCFINENTGFIPLGNRKVFKTTDFGMNWDSVGTVDTSFPSWGLYCIGFADENTGWAGGESGRFYKSTDGGGNWIRENTLGEPVFWRRISVYSDSVVWICGGGGRILHTTTGGETFTNIENITNFIQKDYQLLQNYPNPFNSSTTIKFEINRRAEVRLVIHDISGKEIYNSPKYFKIPGQYSELINFNGYTTGVYFYSLIIDGELKSTKKMLYLK